MERANASRKHIEILYRCAIRRPLRKADLFSGGQWHIARARHDIRAQYIARASRDGSDNQPASYAIVATAAVDRLREITRQQFLCCCASYSYAMNPQTGNLADCSHAPGYPATNPVRERFGPR